MSSVCVKLRSFTARSLTNSNTSIRFGRMMKRLMDRLAQVCDRIDDRYYEVERPGSPAERVAILARKRISGVSAVLIAPRPFSTSASPMSLASQRISSNVAIRFPFDISRLPPTGVCRLLMDHLTLRLPMRYLSMSAA
jgi:hypothetical protein